MWRLDEEIWTILDDGGKSDEVRVQEIIELCLLIFVLIVHLLIMNKCECPIVKISMMELQQDFGTMIVSIVNVWHFVNMFFWIFGNKESMWSLWFICSFMRFIAELGGCLRMMEDKKLLDGW